MTAYDPATDSRVQGELREITAELRKLMSRDERLQKIGGRFQERMRRPSSKQSRAWLERNLRRWGRLCRNQHPFRH